MNPAAEAMRELGALPLPSLLRLLVFICHVFCQSFNSVTELHATLTVGAMHAGCALVRWRAGVGWGWVQGGGGGVAWRGCLHVLVVSASRLSTAFAATTYDTAVPVNEQLRLAVCETAVTNMWLRCRLLYHLLQNVCP